MMFCVSKRKNLKIVISPSMMLGKLLLLGTFFIFLFSGCIKNIKTKSPTQTTTKNVIMFVYDGQSTGAITCSRWYKGQPLAMDEMASGLCSNYMGDSIIPGSAAAATAFGTGFITNTRHVSVLPTTPVKLEGLVIKEDEKGRPVANLLEGAKLVGKSTGLIATSFIQHATPACFSAHTENRSNYELIAEQQVYMGIDVVLGGGSQFLIPKSENGSRKDGENLIKELKKLQYDYLTTREQLVNSSASKLWGMFAGFALDYDIDRKYLHPEQPSLADMTQKAIEVLSKNPKGFFLFVEASKTDWAAHANDPTGVISDMLALDQAVAVALDFAKSQKNTMVLVFPDHGSGGMSIGNTATNGTYDQIPKEMVFDPLRKAKLTGEGIGKFLLRSDDLSEERVKKVIAEYFGITDITEDEMKAIYDCKGRANLNTVLGPMISKRSFIGWSTKGHIGNDVPLHSFGPGRPIGHFHQIDIAKICARFLGFNLMDISKKLFVDAQQSFHTMNLKAKIDKSDTQNPVLVAQKDNLEIRIPFFKNKIFINSKEFSLPGVTVFISKTNKIYIPKMAIDLVKKEVDKVLQ